MSLEDAEAENTGFQDFLAKEAGEEVSAPEETEGQAEQQFAEPEEIEEIEAAEAEESESDVSDDEPELEESEPSEYVEFMLDSGETVQLTPDELKGHYLRQQDYTRKTQSLAEKTRAVDEDRQRFEAVYQQRIQQLEQVMQSEQPIDWEARFRDDPLEAPLEYHKWQESQKQKQHLVAENQHYAQQRREQHLADQGRMLPEIIPHWQGNPEAQQTETVELKNALLEDGFNPEDVSQIADARLVKWLLAGHRQLKMESTAKKVIRKKVAGKPRVVKPGSAKQKTSSKSKMKSKLDTARISNSPEDWTSVFEELL
tara:strand:+ start:2107 stop:3045 length:939 start_codon:yes stop_codon:yes gene_type:complete